MSGIQELAKAIDGLIVALDLLAQNYVDAAEKIDVEYRAAHNGNPHPVMERRHEHVRHAIGSRTYLARVLGVSGVNPGVTIAGIIHGIE